MSATSEQAKARILATSAAGCLDIPTGVAEHDLEAAQGYLVQLLRQLDASAGALVEAAEQSFVPPDVSMALQQHRDLCTEALGAARAVRSRTQA